MKVIYDKETDTLSIILRGYGWALGWNIVGNDWTLVGTTREAQGDAAKQHQTEHFHRVNHDASFACFRAT